jgi:hypothetical protein
MQTNFYISRSFMFMEYDMYANISGMPGIGENSHGQR